MLLRRTLTVNSVVAVISVVTLISVFSVNSVSAVITIVALSRWPRTSCVYVFAFRRSRWRTRRLRRPLWENTVVVVQGTRVYVLYS